MQNIHDNEQRTWRVNFFVCQEAWLTIHHGLRILEELCDSLEHWNAHNAKEPKLQLQG